jgi:hypothetical protein
MEVIKDYCKKIIVKDYIYIKDKYWNKYMDEHYVWRYGDKAERSTKKGSPSVSSTKVTEEKPLIRTDMDLFFTEFVQSSNITDKDNLKHRDEANNKLNMRYMVQQVSQNPFLQGTNYIDDLETQDKFLRPKQPK